MIKAKIEVIGKHEIVYLRQVGKYGGKSQFELMTQFKDWINKKGLEQNVQKHGVLGIAQDNPELTLAENCRYDVALFVSEIPELEYEKLAIQKGTFQGGKYGVFTVPHTSEAIAQFWGDLAQHVENNHLQMRPMPIVERYREEVGADKVCEFLLPIV